MSATTQPKPRTASHTKVISSLEDIVTVAAESKLLKSPYAELRHVSCEFHEGTLTLRGSVSCYYLKQVAQSAISRLGSVAEIDNQLNVAPLPS